MHRIYPKLLKKMTYQKIGKMRDLYRAGYSTKRLSDIFKISTTTVNWHLGELKRCEHLEVE
jgi:DNA invertase Pin-like site-specific DNA recombinase